MEGDKRTLPCYSRNGLNIEISANPSQLQPGCTHIDPRCRLPQQYHAVWPTLAKWFTLTLTLMSGKKVSYVAQYTVYSDMTCLQGPTVSPNKLAMSRALGAAFLTHQVEQLEKSVASGTTGPASGNWRRQQPSQSPPRGHGTQVPSANPNGNAKRPPMAPGIKVASRKPGEDSQAARKARGTGRDAGAGVGVSTTKGQAQPHDVRRKEGGERAKESTKDADIVVVDASVLVHALYQLKKWCRDGREEVVIVPLEGQLLVSSK